MLLQNVQFRLLLTDDGDNFEPDKTPGDATVLDCSAKWEVENLKHTVKVSFTSGASICCIQIRQDTFLISNRTDEI